MISKPLITTLAIWLTATFGWVGNQVNNSVSAQGAPVAVVAEVTQPQVLDQVAVESILRQKFKLNEVSERVADLQKVIGTVAVDGHYGMITRREHIEALEARGLPTANVPKQNTPKYNISYDPAKRCPMWEPLFAEYGLPVDVFSYIAWRESGCNPKAQNETWKNGKMTYALNKNGSYDTGLLQVNSSWFTAVKGVCGEDAVDNHMQGLKDPVCNVKFAKWLMDNSKGQLGNWSVYKV